jgi:DNA-binding response OmpR family regulator
MSTKRNKSNTKVTATIPVDESNINDTSDRINIPMDGSQLNEKDVDPVDAESKDLDNKTVLLVEDNRELRFLITYLLKPEFNVVQARDGQEGINAAFKHIPDIIITDVMMPGIDGYELCTVLKKDERTSHIPVILLTASEDAEGSLKGYQTGADDYITKPFANEHLKLKVRNIISTREAARNQFDFKSLLSPEGLKIGVTDKKFMRKSKKKSLRAI